MERPLNLLLDTNIIIDWYTNGPSSAYLGKWIKETETKLYTSIICAIEFLSKAKRPERDSFYSLINKKEIALYPLIYLHEASAIAEIRTKTGLKTPDAIIVNTAKENKCTLVTRDKEIYEKAKKICSIELIP